MISVVVDSLVLLQVSMVKYIVDDFTIDPQNIPVVSFNLLVSFSLQRIRDTILKCCLEFDLGTIYNHMNLRGLKILLVLWVCFFLDIFSEVFRHILI